MDRKAGFSSIRRLIFVYFAVIALLSIAALAFFSYRSKERLLIEGIDRQLETAAFAAANILPRDWHERGKVTEDEDLVNVLRLTDLANSSGLAFVYSFGWDPVRGVYFTSSNATEEQLKSGEWVRHGLPYPEARPEIVELFKATNPCPAILEGSDSYGNFRSALIARTGPNGSRYVVGADLRIDGLRQQARKQLWGVLGTAVCVFAAAAIGSIFLSKRIARPLMALEEALNNLNSEDLSRPGSELRKPFEEVGLQRRDEIGKLGAAFGRMLERLEGAQAELRTEIRQRERLENELKVTRKIQQLALPLPDELGQVRGLDLASFMRPAETVGGDYYDILPQAGSVRVGIGDVTDHGLESGIFMLMMQTAARTLVEMGVRDPKVFLGAINATLCKNVRRLKTDRSATLTYVEFEPGRLMVSGQHEDILVIKPDGSHQVVNTMDLGFPVGMVEDIDSMLDTRYIDVTQDDIVILYTDGVTEAEDHGGTLYGLERLIAVALNHRASTAEEIKDAIITNVMDHIRDHTVHDDITLVVVKIN